MIISTEKAFDILPYAVSIIEKLDMKGYILQNKELINTEDKDKVNKIMDEKGFDFVMHILKNTSKVKTEVFDIIAVVQDKSVNEVKSQPINITINLFKTLLQDTELMRFFKLAVK